MKFTKKEILLGILIFLLFNKKQRKPMPTDKKEFIKYIYPFCVTIGNKIGVPPMFLLAQIILETNWGKSTLFTKYFNVGGIKAVKGQTFVSLPTYEYIKGVKTRINQNFATYSDLGTGLNEYAKIFMNKYFNKYRNKTDNPKEFAKLLQSGAVKYATDINYTSKINSIIDNVNKYV